MRRTLLHKCSMNGHAICMCGKNALLLTTYIYLLYSFYANYFCPYCQSSTLFHGYTLSGNRQKKAKAMIEASGLKMIAVEDFDLAARTVCVWNIYRMLCYNEALFWGMVA